ncbi:hypothetical protein [Microbacterium sp. NPDC087665]|uniref:hypothetical protein n=1 Tax=Microbacterium sp. NPDC087665 TaxID=3364194 RepID=UPI00381BCD0A
MTKTTPVYQLPYLEGNDGGKAIGAVSLSLAQRLEAVLMNEGQTPLDSDLVSLLQRIAALENATAPVDDTGWRTLVLQNNWKYFGGGIYAEPRYRRLNGIVYVSGLIKDGTTSPGGVIANLPVGFRPSKQRITTVSVSPGVGGTVDMAANGNILHGTLSTTFTSLDIVFPAEQ